MSKYLLPKVPRPYVLVEYIKGTGDQNINTGVMPDADIGVKIRMAGTAYTSGANKPIVGATVSDLRSSGVFDIELWGSGIYFGFGTWGANTHKLVTTNVVNEIYDLELNYLNSGYFRKDSESKAIPSYSGEFANYSIRLFALNRSGSASTSNLPAKIYSAQFSKGTTIIRNYIPVKNSLTNEYGMYDLVTKQFYGNAGTGSFTGGDEIKQREYLTSDGNPYIDLGFIPTGDNWELDVKWDATSDDTTKRTVLGSQNSQNILTIYNTSFYCCGSTNDQENRIKNLSFGAGIHTANIKGNNHLVTPNVSTGSTYNVPYSANTNMTGLNGNMYLFKNNNTSSQVFIGDIYYFKWIQNGVTTRDMVPITVGNVGAMYDLVSNKIYLNAGTDSFTYGEVVPDLEVKQFLNEKAIKSKNLFDASTEIVGKYINDSGAIVSNNSYTYSDFIPVVVGKTYTASLHKVSGAPSGALRIHAYDSDGVWQQLLLSVVNLETGTVTIPAGIPYIRISWWKAEYATDRQFEEGSTATAYEPFGDKINTYLAVKAIKNKNLLDTSTDNLTTWGASSGKLSYYSDGSRHSYIIDCGKYGLSAGDVLTLSCSSRGNASYWNIGCYTQIVDGETALLYEQTATVLTKTITLPEGTNYIVVFNGVGFANNQQMEKGSTATPYEPFGYTIYHYLSTKEV